MKKAGLVLAMSVLSAAFLLGAAPFTPDDRTKVEKLADCSVMVRAGKFDYGSGVAFKHGKREFVWTNAHVVESAVTIKETPDKDDKEKVDISITFKPVKVHATQDCPGASAIIRRYHSVEDLALLEITKPLPFLSGSARLRDVAAAGGRLKVGQSLWLVSCPHTERFSFAKHRVSMVHSVKRNGFSYNQTTGAFYPGSSGGGLFSFCKVKKEFFCVGLLSRYAYAQSHGMALHIPSGRIREFARAYKCEWAVSEGVSLPEADKVCPYLDKGLIELE